MKLKNLEKRDFEQEYEKHLAELKRLDYDKQPVQICEKDVDLFLQEVKLMFTSEDVAEVEESGGDKIAARIDMRIRSMRMSLRLRRLRSSFSDVLVNGENCQVLNTLLDKNVGRLEEVERLLAK